MKAYKRNGNKWTVNETLALQREYELLEWTVQEISAKHERSIGSILFKLTSETFIPSWNDARGFNIADYAVSVLCQVAHCDNEGDNDDDDEDYVDEDEDEDCEDEDDEDYDCEDEDEAEDEDCEADDEDDEDYDCEAEDEDEDEDEDCEADDEDDEDYDCEADEDEDEEDDEDYEADVDVDQGWSLKESVTEIGNMVKLMFQVMSASKQRQNKHLSSSSM